MADDSTDKNAGDGLTPIVSVRPQNADDPKCKHAVNEQNDTSKVAEDEPRRKKLIMSANLVTVRVFAKELAFGTTETVYGQTSQQMQIVRAVS